MLAEPLAIGDVHDVEGACRTVLTEELRRRGAFLEPADFDDALAYLIAEAWVASTRYHPDRGTTLRTWLFWSLRTRIVPEYYRHRFGRNGHRAPPGGYFDPWDDAAQRALERTQR